VREIKEELKKAVKHLEIAVESLGATPRTGQVLAAQKTALYARYHAECALIWLANEEEET